MTNLEILEGFRAKPGLCVALDQDDQLSNLRLAEKVASEVDALKLNDDAVDDAGLEQLVKPFLQFGRLIFIDMKMFKGARTMAARSRKAAELGVGLVNAFALADHLLRRTVETLAKTDTRLLAVTVLTHMDEAYCQKYFRCSLQEAVRMFSETAVDVGAYGSILPGTALNVVSNLDLFKANPGIRPLWSPRSNDQESTVTPAEAVRGGSNLIICGGPIANYLEAEGGPLVGARRIKEEMEEAMAA